MPGLCGILARAGGGYGEPSIRRLGVVAIGVLFLSHAAAGATGSIISFSAQSQNVAGIMSAADTLMNSAVGKEFPSRLFLQVNVADGENPATRRFVPAYQTAAEGEAFTAKPQADVDRQPSLGSLGH
jgi:hypothetical protein